MLLKVSFLTFTTELAFKQCCAYDRNNASTLQLFTIFKKIFRKNKMK